MARAPARAPEASRARSATLRLDAAIYVRPALDRASKAYAQLAKIEISRDGRDQVVRFKEMEPEVADKLPDEFANYALGCLVTVS